MNAIEEIKARLAAPGTPFAMVKGATSLALVKDRPEALPAAFVLTARDVSAENSRTNGPVMQRTERDIMVVIVAENVGDHDGEATIDELEALKQYVRGRLIGFSASDMKGEPITHVGGEITEAVAGTAWFDDTFSAPTYLTETNAFDPQEPDHEP